MSIIYRAEFVIQTQSETKAGQEEHNAIREPNTKTIATSSVMNQTDTGDMINELNMDVIQSVGKKATGIVIGSTLAITNYQTQNHLAQLNIQGDSIAARHAQNSQAILNNTLQDASTVLFGAIAGGPIGALVAVGGIGIKYAIKGVNYSRDLKVARANREIEDRFYSMEAERFAHNRKEFR